MILLTRYCPINNEAPHFLTKLTLLSSTCTIINLLRTFTLASSYHVIRTTMQTSLYKLYLLLTMAALAFAAPMPDIGRHPKTPLWYYLHYYWHKDCRRSSCHNWRYQSCPHVRNCCYAWVQPALGVIHLIYSIFRQRGQVICMDWIRTFVQSSKVVWWIWVVEV